MPSFLAVRHDEYLQHVSPEPFIGLPHEELERLHGAIPVLALDQPDALRLPLTAYAAIHYNYNWLMGLDGAGSLGKRVALPAIADPPAFLDEALHKLARQQLEAADLPTAPCEWRCAGLARDDSQVALVYVVRLRQRPDTAPSSSLMGNTELRFGRATFDAFSQLVIDYLHAL
ncbi:MAG TPA: hypothetical protein VFN67_36015 [Polyangiales bacterium]|nr:hypothetical protein [Polyangiales bacterium]